MVRGLAEVPVYRGGRDPLVTGEDVIRVMRICLAAWESVETKAAVRLAP